MCNKNKKIIIIAKDVKTKPKNYSCCFLVKASLYNNNMYSQ